MPGVAVRLSTWLIYHPDVQQAFPNAQAVNDVLRDFLELAQASVKTNPTTRAPRQRSAS